MEKLIEKLNLTSCFDDFLRRYETSISDEVPESNICKALSLTCHEVKPNDLSACHSSKKNDTVIVKFKSREKNAASLLTESTSVINKINLTHFNFSSRVFTRTISL